MHVPPLYKTILVLCIAASDCAALHCNILCYRPGRASARAIGLIQVGTFALIATLFMYDLIKLKLATAVTYQEHEVPEFEVQGYVVFSAYDLQSKSLLSTSLLSVTACYRSWRYSAKAVLVQKAVLLSELHGTNPKLLCSASPATEP